MRLFEDFVFNVEYLQYAERVAFVNAPLYIYVMHQSHVSLSMSIINSESLLHDMHIFRTRANDYFRKGASRRRLAVRRAGNRPCPGPLRHHFPRSLLRADYAERTNGRCMRKS